MPESKLSTSVAEMAIYSALQQHLHWIITFTWLRW